MNSLLKKVYIISRIGFWITIAIQLTLFILNMALAMGESSILMYLFDVFDLASLMFFMSFSVLGLVIKRDELTPTGTAIVVISIVVVLYLHLPIQFEPPTALFTLYI